MDYIETAELIDAVRARVFSTLTPKRYAHCESTARTAAELAYRFGYDEKNCYLAGLAHDMCREMSIDAQENLVARESSGIDFLRGYDSMKALFADPAFRAKMIHGPAAACALFQDFGVHDMMILEAVALHSIADEKMSPCTKIVYIADKLEPRRSRPADAEESLRVLDLDGLFEYTIACVVRWFSDSGKTLAPFTKELYNRMLAK